VKNGHTTSGSIYGFGGLYYLTFYYLSIFIAEPYVFGWVASPFIFKLIKISIPLWIPHPIH
jgi:hypothetical protein